MRDGGDCRRKRSPLCRFLFCFRVYQSGGGGFARAVCSEQRRNERNDDRRLHAAAARDKRSGRPRRRQVAQATSGAQADASAKMRVDTLDERKIATTRITKKPVARRRAQPRSAKSEFFAQKFQI